MNKLFFYFTIILVVCFSCSSCINNKGHLKEWDYTISSKESKERNVFSKYYVAEPFEYEDSIFSVKLVFKEVYAEYWHWYDREHSQWKQTNHLYLVAIIDTTQSFMIDKLDSCSNICGYETRGQKYYKEIVSCKIENEKYWIIQPNAQLTDTFELPICSTPAYSSAIQHDIPFSASFGKIVFHSSDNQTDR